MFRKGLDRDDGYDVFSASVLSCRQTKHVSYTAEQTFDKQDFTQTGFPRGEYEGCTFINCNFSNVNLSGSRFTECTFTLCNLSLAKLEKTSLQEVTFKDCKMLGLHLENCNGFGMSFSFNGCTLDHTSFFKTKIKKTVFKNCQIHEADFSECDLTAAVLDNCDLRGSTFENTLLEKADLRSSFNYSINPEANKIKGARFSLPAVIGLLDKYDIRIEQG